MSDVIYTRIQNARRAAFASQHGKCFYCGCTMWEPTMEHKVDACMRLLGLSSTVAGVKRQIVKLKATAEHVIKREDGGNDQDDNIVAACMDCNTRRGDLSVDVYLLHVKGIQDAKASREVAELQIEYTTS